ncbi:hypothetical protein B0H66DRAFT_638339 [Apodospora peruviana]|uniref:Uncharacterized protein n=1 Tax=Apodospora peruviana TaxID=516989 RepID=A0AAE0M710_9PEZI|nr:hypothetical protein B0H66DRAFT_638339 [Apodospora peruviana]
MLGFINTILGPLGPFAVIGKDLYDDATSTFSALGDDPDAFAAAVMDAAPSPDDANAGDQVNNVFYININKTADTPQEQAQLQAITANVNLSNMFCNWKANQAVQAQIASKALTDTPLNRANYKAKVVNTLVATAPWIPTYGAKVLSKTFQVEKSAFHAALVSTFTQGLGLPTSINTMFEGLLTNMQNTINVSTTNVDSNKTDCTFFILLTTYVKDDQLQTWRPQMRTIYFKVHQSLSSYTISKKNSGTNVNVTMEYAQSDGSFNNDYFASNAAATISSLVNQASNNFLNSTVNVDV